MKNIDLTTNTNSHKDGKYLVSAIVSVYNCERFIAGCLQDIENQTIADKTEIIIVNSGSQQNEKVIIRRFQEKYNNIIYLKTANRESIYKAWNIGIKAASGKYITNANADDRHRKDSFEIMTSIFENNDNIDLIYADYIATRTENETFEDCTPIGYAHLIDSVNQSLLLDRGWIGCQPMWRKEIHDNFGYFDENLEIAGDYEFWLRISETCTFYHVNELLGLYLYNPESAERRDYEKTATEVIDVLTRYIHKIKNNSQLENIVKKKLSLKYSDLGYYYLKKRRNFEAIQICLKGIKSDHSILSNYKILLASYAPYRLLKLLKIFQ